MTLTIDVRLQRIVEEGAGCGPVVRRQSNSRRGGACSMCARAKSSPWPPLPSFDPNIFNPGTPVQTIEAVFNDPASPMLNRATGARYPPGSTFKPITLLAGLASGAISPQDTVTCSGSLVIGNWQSIRSTVGTIAGTAASECLHGHYRIVRRVVLRGRHEDRRGCHHQDGRLNLDSDNRPDSTLGSENPRSRANPAWKRRNKGRNGGRVIPRSCRSAKVTCWSRRCRWPASRQRLPIAARALHPYVVKRIETAEGQVVHEGQPDVRAHLSASPQQIEFVRHAMLGAVQDAGGTAHRAA